MTSCINEGIVEDDDSISASNESTKIERNAPLGQHGANKETMKNNALEQVVERKEVIEDAATDIMELEKETHVIAEDITKFWGNLVQDDQLHQ